MKKTQCKKRKGQIFLPIHHCEPTYLHEGTGKKTLIGRHHRRGQMLEPSGLEPPRHDRVPGVHTSGLIAQIRRPGAGMALPHLATHVALPLAFRRQFRTLRSAPTVDLNEKPESPNQKSTKPIRKSCHSTQIQQVVKKSHENLSRAIYADRAPDPVDTVRVISDTVVFGKGRQ